MARAKTASRRDTRRGSAATKGSGGGGSVAIRDAIVSASSPGNARRAQTASKSVHASENWSLLALNSASASASGAL